MRTLHCTFKKVLSCVLTLALIFSMLVSMSPMEVYAEVQAHTDHSVCGEASCPGHPKMDGTHSTVTWEPLLEEGDGVVYDSATNTYTVTRQITLEAGHYYLPGNVVFPETNGVYDNINIDSGVSGDVSICLNGYMLRTMGRYKNTIIHSGSGSLNICDCNGSNGVYKFAVTPLEDATTPMLWTLDENGTETIEGGIITGDSANEGGSVIYSNKSGNINYYGGTIVGTRAMAFQMNMSDCELNLYDGTIIGNCIMDNSYRALIYMNRSYTTLFMYGGTITRNYVKKEILGGDYPESGSGLYGGEITHNYAKGVVFGNSSTYDSFYLGGNIKIIDNIDFYYLTPCNLLNWVTASDRKTSLKLTEDEELLLTEDALVGITTKVSPISTSTKVPVIYSGVTEENAKCFVSDVEGAEFLHQNGILYVGGAFVRADFGNDLTTAQNEALALNGALVYHTANTVTGAKVVWTNSAGVINGVGVVEPENVTVSVTDFNTTSRTATVSITADAFAVPVGTYTFKLQLVNGEETVLTSSDYYAFTIEEAPDPYINVGAQNGVATYGTAASVEYTVNEYCFREEAPYSPYIEWEAGSAPEGVTASLDTVNNKLVIISSDDTPAGQYRFTIASGTDSEKVVSATATFEVNKQTINHNLSATVGFPGGSTTVTLPELPDGLVYSEVLGNNNGKLDVSLDGNVVTIAANESTTSGMLSLRMSVTGTNNNYAFGNVYITVSIAKKTITATADNAVNPVYGTPSTKYYTVTCKNMAQAEHDNVEIVWVEGTAPTGVTTTIANRKLSIVTTENTPVGTYEFKLVSGDIVSAVYTVTVEKREITIAWGETEFVYDGDYKVPVATAGNLVNGDEVVCVVGGEQTEVGEGYVATVVLLSGEDSANYKLPVNATTTFKITKASQSAPTGITKTDETIAGKGDGKISGLNDTMEIRYPQSEGYVSCSEAELTNLSAGTYYIRLKETTNKQASEDVAITIETGEKITVVLPTTMDGYTIIPSKTELSWGEDLTFKVEVKSGYTKDGEFKVLVNGEEIQPDENGEYLIPDVEGVVSITVSGVKDITAPIATITLEDNWKTLWNNLTFGLFFKETKTFEITAQDLDTGSGIGQIYYYLADKEIADVESITEWETYTGPVSVNPDKVFVIYAKVVDNAGNISYVNSDGIILDATSPVISGIENQGKYYGKAEFTIEDDYLKSITIDNVSMEIQDKYVIVADNGEHTIVVTDKAGNEVTYVISVYEIYKVTYIVDGEEFAVEQVNYGEDATLPTIPKKVGFDDVEPKWDKDGKNITEDTIITAVYTKNEPGKIDIIKPDGKDEMNIEPEKIKEIIPFTEEELKLIEQGQDVNIWVDILDVEKSVTSVEKLAVQNAIGDNVLCTYFTPSIFKQIGENTPVKVDNVTGKVKVTMKISEKFIDESAASGRVYQIIRIKNGVTEVVEATYDAVAKTMSFETDGVSVYVLSYQDESYQDEKVDDQNKEDSGTVGAGNSNTVDMSDVKTGDDNVMWLWWTLAIVAGSTGVVLIRKRRENFGVK